MGKSKYTAAQSHAIDILKRSGAVMAVHINGKGFIEWAKIPYKVHPKVVSFLIKNELVIKGGMLYPHQMYSFNFQPK